MKRSEELIFKIASLLVLTVLVLGPTGCKQENTVTEDEVPVTYQASDPMTDTEGNVYQTIHIGNQIWMAENLKSATASDGTALQGAWAYGSNENHVADYGRLYTLAAALNACPDGWHLPTLEEWNTLIATVGSNPGTKLKLGGTSGFNAMMGGRKSGDSFGYMGDLGAYLTATTGNPDHVHRMLFVINEPGVSQDQAPADEGLSVRYIKDR